jgi:hypothetical protein
MVKRKTTNSKNKVGYGVFYYDENGELWGDRFYIGYNFSRSAKRLDFLNKKYPKNRNKNTLLRFYIYDISKSKN